MIQPGMMFGSEGPIMQGTWYNPHSGDSFTVRDSFFEDNQYVITTTDGRYLRYDQIQNYIQTDMKPEDLKNLKQNNNKTITTNTLPDEVANLIASDDDNMLLPEDAALINPKITSNAALGNIYQPHIQPNIQSNPSNVNVDMNTAIIEKALKTTVKPILNVDIKWEEYPKKQIEMLTDIMDISVNDIVDWYLDSIQLDDFILAFKNAITQRINSNMSYSASTSVELPDEQAILREYKDKPKDVSSTKDEIKSESKRAAKSHKNPTKRKEK
jgi:hypothetical protein